jgi:hypothetical protein
VRISLLFAFILLSVASQSPARAAPPEPVPLIARSGQRSPEWYRQQADLWKNIVRSDSTDVRAWRNYYLATEYSFLASQANDDKERTLDPIFAAMGSAVPHSYEYRFIRQRRASFADLAAKIALIEEALQHCADCPELYANLATAWEMSGQTERASEIWTKLYRSQYLAPGLLDFNYNVLMSTLPNAILFTNGDNDTFPAWVLQRAQTVRTDVLLLNLHLVWNDRSYLSRKLQEGGIDLSASDLPEDRADFVATLTASLEQTAPEIPVYFALTVGNEFRERINDNLYMVGLASRYSSHGIDNLGQLRHNLERRFRLDYLAHDWYSEDHPSTRPVVSWLNTNYAYPFFLLADHYQISGEPDREGFWRQRAFDVARDYPLLFKQLHNRTPREK